MTPTYIIYCLTCNVNGKRYVGQTRTSLDLRMASHMSDSRRVSRKHCVIHGAIAKHGISSFTVEVLADNLAEAEVDEREKYFIATFRSSEKAFGYNRTSGGQKSHTMSEAAKKKLSATLKLLRGNEEYREHIRQASLMRWSDPEYVERGRRRTELMWKNPEYAGKIRSASTGKRHTPEAREKMKLAWARRDTPELREGMRQRAIQRFKDPDSMEKHKAGQRGRRHSEETKRKIAEAGRRRYKSGPVGG